MKLYGNKMTHPKIMLQDAAEECGWTESTQIDVLCDFIAQMNRVQPDFKAYLDQRVDEEFGNEEEDEEDEEV